MRRQRQWILQQVNEIIVQKSAIEMYSTHNERKSVAADRFISTLKNKSYKYTPSLSKNVYIDKLDDIVTTINYHRQIKMKPVDVKQSIYMTLVKKLMRKVLNLKMMILLMYKISLYKYQ